MAAYLAAQLGSPAAKRIHAPQAAPAKKLQGGECVEVNRRQGCHPR